MDSDPIFFKDAAAFRKWLHRNHNKEKSLVAGYYKIGSGLPSMTWPQSVDMALCYGWIDGVRRSVDETSYTIRFTPRRPRSIWSAVNLKKMEVLIAAGLMQPSGYEVYKNRDLAKTNLYSFENEAKQLPPAYQQIFKSNKPAWAYFSKLAPSYQKVTIHWIMAAKQEATRLSRLQRAIEDSANQKKTW